MQTLIQTDHSAGTPGFIQARVVDAGQDLCRLSSPNGAFTARRAASCLLQPAAGDTVLAADVEGSLWILAVLVRGDSPAVLPLPADSTLRVAEGGLKLVVQDELVLAAGRQLSAVAPEVSVQA